MRSLATLAFVAVFVSGCSCSKDERSSPATAEILPGAGGGSVPEPLIAQTASALRLTPEQIANQIEDTLEFRLGWTDETTGVFQNLITRLFAVPLGGVDFISASKRDASTKVQTLLIARGLSWHVAAGVVFRDANVEDDTPDPIVFKLCDVGRDRPVLAAERVRGGSELASLEESEARWTAQLEDLYWRLYARAPTPSEVADVKAVFLETLETEKWPGKAWVVVLYALLSSAEYWNL